MKEPKMSFVASCRLNGTTLFFIERFATDFSDAVVVMDDGRIPMFASEADARTELARRFPLPRGKPLTEQSSMEEIAAAMEDNYGRHIKLFYDLDAVRAWARAPGPSDAISPAQALLAWELCWQVGTAPIVQPFDPMGMYALFENMQREPDRRDAYETLLLGMKLTGIVRIAREARQDPRWDLEVKDLGEFWPKTDYERLGMILVNGIDLLAERVR